MACMRSYPMLIGVLGLEGNILLPTGFHYPPQSPNPGLVWSDPRSFIETWWTPSTKGLYKTWSSPGTVAGQGRGSMKEHQLWGQAGWVWVLILSSTQAPWPWPETEALWVAGIQTRPFWGFFGFFVFWFIYLFYFGCIGSLLLRVGFL